MPLNNLSLEQLTELAGTLEQIRDAGTTLAAYGLHPVFNLTPGQTATITLPFAMPEAPGQATKKDVARIEAKLDLRLEAMQDSIEANGLHLLPTPSTEAAPGRNPSGEDGGDTPEPVDAPLVPGEVTKGAPISAAAHSRSDDAAAPPPAAPEASPPPLAEAASPEGEAESGGGQAMAAAAPPAATHQDKFLPATWTDEEDTRLVAGIVAAVVGLGITKKDAIRAMAAELGRPFEGTYFRTNHKLKARLETALAEAQAAKTDAEELLSQSPDGPALASATDGSTASEGDAAVGGHSPAAVQDEPDMEPGQRAAEIAVHAVASIEGQKAIVGPASMIADPVTAHLIALTDKGGWTLDRDLELMELSIAGWQPNEIALQIKMQASAIKPRFDTLTGLYQDDDGKKQRRFTREDVHAALQHLAGKLAPGSERGAA